MKKFNDIGRNFRGDTFWSQVVVFNTLHLLRCDAKSAADDISNYICCPDDISDKLSKRNRIGQITCLGLFDLSLHLRLDQVDPRLGKSFYELMNKEVHRR